MRIPDRRLCDTRPASRWEDAFAVGNGVQGALVHGRPDDETVIVTHHRLVRGDGSSDPPPPVTSDLMDEVRELVLSGRSAEALELVTSRWTRRVPRPFHPAAALRWRLPVGGRTRDYLRWLDLSTGVAGTRWEGRHGTWTATCCVSRADDVVVQCLYPPAPARHAVPEVWHDVRLPAHPPGLDVHERRIPAPAGSVLVTRVDYPAAEAYPGVGALPPRDAGGYVLATRTVTSVGAEKATLLLTAVVPRPAGENPRALETRLLERLTALPVAPADLLARHAARHRPVMDRVRLDLHADPEERRLPTRELLRRAETRGEASPALLEALFDTGRHLLLSASGVLPPRLVGLWQGDWDAAWSGALTLDANLPLQLAAAVVGDVPQAVHAVADLVDAQREGWRSNARRIFGTRGVVAPAHTDGGSGVTVHTEPAYPLHLWSAGAHWLLTTLLDHADATGDADFLRARVLPVLREVAEFYEDLLTDAEGRPRVDADGHLLLAPSYSPENRPADPCPTGPTPLTVNATMDVAAAGDALRRAARLCAEGTPQASRWRALADALPPYRVTGEGTLAEWVHPGLRDRHDHRHVSHLYPVWPLHGITPASTPELAAAAGESLRRRTGEDGSAHGAVHQALAAARLRDAEQAGRALSSLVCGEYFFDGLASSHYGGRGVFNTDAACALPGVLLEMLLDSAPGVVELLPAVPPALARGTLRGALTRTGVRIEALAWNVAKGETDVVLRSHHAQRITLVCAGARTCEQIPLDHPAGSQDHPAGFPGPAVHPLPRSGSWHVDAPAGTSVRFRLGPGPHRRDPTPP